GLQIFLRYAGFSFEDFTCELLCVGYALINLSAVDTVDTVLAVALQYELNFTHVVKQAYQQYRVFNHYLFANDVSIPVCKDLTNYDMLQFTQVQIIQCLNFQECTLVLIRSASQIFQVTANAVDFLFRFQHLCPNLICLVRDRTAYDVENHSANQ